MKQIETIVCSAVQFNGLDVGGRRHKDCYKIIRTIAPDFRDEHIDRSKQGFITSTGRFVNRKEAWKIADRAGQIIYGYAASNNGENSELISENLFADAEDVPVDETKELLINWLCEEYTREDAERQINSASIVKTDDIVTITYDNHIIDTVRISNGVVTQLPDVKLLLQTEVYSKVQEFVKRHGIKFVRWIDGNAGHELAKTKDGKLVEIRYTYRDNNPLNRIYNVLTTNLTQ